MYQLILSPTIFYILWSSEIVETRSNQSETHFIPLSSKALSGGGISKKFKDSYDAAITEISRIQEVANKIVQDALKELGKMEDEMERAQNEIGILKKKL